MYFNLNFIINIGRSVLKMIVDNQSDAYAIIDNHEILIKYNKAFANFFLKAFTKPREKNRKLEDILYSGVLYESEVSSLIDKILKSAASEYENKIEQYFASIDKHFLIEKKAMTSQNTYIGSIVMFRDITEYKRLMEKMKYQNEELLIINHELANYVQTVKELTLERERNRIETEMHNLMSHNLNVLLRLMEVCRISIHSDRERAYSAILDAESIIKDTAKNIEEIAKGLDTETAASSYDHKPDKLDFLKVMLDSFAKNTGIRVDYFFEGDFSEVDSSVTKAIYNICQEAVTNSMKHGSAKMITILLKCQNGVVHLSVLDDGTGCKSISKSGIGLRGMEDMVHELKGNIEFKSADDDGFKISAVFPMTGGCSN